MEFDRSGLAEDFDKVSSAEAAIQEIEDRILTYRASGSEVLQWYFVKDPIRQSFYENLAKTIDSFDVDVFISQVLRDGLVEEAMEKGAMAIAVSVLMPTVMQDDESNWYAALSELYRETNGSNDAEIPMYEMFFFCFENCSNNAIATEDFEKLNIVAEMLVKSSADHAFEIAELIKDGGDWQDLKQEYIAWQPSQRQTINLAISRQLTALNIDIILGSINENPDARKYLLHTVPLFIANEINGIRTPTEDSSDDLSGMQERAEVLQIYIDLLELIATGDNRVQHEGKSVKGALHEAIWLLDMLMLREYNKGDLTIIPSASNEDMPKIGYPTHNRSFDFTIIGPGKGDWLIQLKSTPSNPNKNNRSNYHPEIDLKDEQNFRDFHHKTLQSKLNLYRSFINSGYKDPALRSRVEKMTLDTAATTFEEYTNRHNSMHNHMVEKFEKLGITLSTPPPNYERRIRAVLAGEEDPGFNRAHKRILSKMKSKPVQEKQSTIKPTKRTNGSTKSKRKK